MKNTILTIAATLAAHMCSATEAATIPPVAPLSKLQAEWVQWAYSVPNASSPITDTDGANCSVGQHGNNWFLAGSFGEGPVARHCNVPQGKTLFFPVLNYTYFDNPGLCGQRDSISVAEMRTTAAEFIDAVTDVWVEVDGHRVNAPVRLRSPVFEMALPADNLYTAGCEGGLPAGIYSPAIDDGYYAVLPAPEPGRHSLRFHGIHPASGFTIEIAYTLDVAPVKVIGPAEEGASRTYRDARPRRPRTGAR
jgi:hypothetical protein